MPLQPTVWHKSSYSTDSQEACVEAAAFPKADTVLIRDSKDRSLPPLSISWTAWSAFLDPHHRRDLNRPGLTERRMRPGPHRLPQR
ncbi:DUF397 domain-containing protein, partial [Streptomyces sp. NPDC058427]|uniref:DUF397 domain-containing protein n=1 Tax=Streptomyces sp. NPDC058427 TaxID=3346494 RepID=UPI00366132CC